jgi:hypothetical protein
MPQTKADRSAAAKKAAATRKRNQERQKAETAGIKAAETRQARAAGRSLSSAKGAGRGALVAATLAARSLGEAAKHVGDAAASKAKTNAKRGRRA